MDNAIKDPSITLHKIRKEIMQIKPTYLTKKVKSFKNASVKAGNAIKEISDLRRLLLKSRANISKTRLLRLSTLLDKLSSMLEDINIQYKGYSSVLLENGRIYCLESLSEIKMLLEVTTQDNNSARDKAFDAYVVQPSQEKVDFFSQAVDLKAVQEAKQNLIALLQPNEQGKYKKRAFIKADVLIIADEQLNNTLSKNPALLSEFGIKTKIVDTVTNYVFAKQQNIVSVYIPYIEKVGSTPAEYADDFLIPFLKKKTKSNTVALGSDANCVRIRDVKYAFFWVIEADTLTNLSRRGVNLAHINRWGFLF